MLRTHVLRLPNCMRGAARSLSTTPKRAINRRTMQFSRGSGAPFVVQSGRAPGSVGKVFAFLGASVAISSAAMFYFLINHKDRAIVVPLYLHLANVRGLLRNELDEDELRDLRETITRQLTARVAVDETIGSLLGVPCAVSIDTTELTVRAPGPSLVCLQIVNDTRRGLTYRLIARSVLGSWWSHNSGSGGGSNGTDIVRLNTQGEVGGAAGPTTSPPVGGPSRDPISASTDIEDAGAHKWDWDSSDQQIVICGAATLVGPGPNVHINHRRENRTGRLVFEAAKSDDVGLRFKRSVLRYQEDDKEITQRLW
ncbi:hypothetical protein D0Z00_002109 [Geotrichum galactomycetum]|uniref:Uncharacterized protein n=1 Tax=Geotrichum galactomycetum TaxID=27317 RepID=A0ACB6V523_9ASCO|nr:hypothetical protein D0Z00_002109 [Geotrichum candidum]